MVDLDGFSYLRQEQKGILIGIYEIEHRHWNMDGAPWDYGFDLIQEEGLCVGGSTGINIAGAIRLARDLGPGHTIVTILCDYGTRYQSKLFNPEFLRTKNLPVPGWLERDGSALKQVVSKVMA